ncbi:MAG: lectin-like protein [Phycisphaerales bacterium]
MPILRSVVSPLAVVLCAGSAWAQPANDLCSSPTAISGFGTFPFDNNAATTDGSSHVACNFFNSQEIYNDIWYCWTASASGPVRLRTCSQTTLDSKIAVYSTCSPCPGATEPIACSDDNCATQTEVSWFAAAGASYLIRVGSFGATAFGSGTFEIGSSILVGPVINPTNNHAYYLLSPSSWTVAEASAVALGGHLVTIRSADENEWVRTMVLGFDGMDRRGWIGLNDEQVEGTFAWTSGDPAAYTNWNGGEPNNSGGLEDYAELFYSNGFWNDNQNAPPLLVYGIVEVTGVPCYANCDGSTAQPLLNVNDFVCFNNRFVAGDAYANCDNSTAVPILNVNDFICFLSKFAAGCS